jgi:hypothetical protein
MKSYTTLLVLFFSAMIMVTCSRSRDYYNTESAKLDENLRRMEDPSKARSTLQSSGSITSSVSHDSAEVKVETKQPKQGKSEKKKIRNGNWTRSNNTDSDSKAEAAFNNINSNTENIHNQICRQRWEIKDTLNQISNQLIVVKEKIVYVQSRGYSKQKLYLKFAKIANMINMAISELKRIADLIEILKCANCDRLNDLIEQFNSVNSIPENLINMTSQSMQQLNVNMNLAYSK